MTNLGPKHEVMCFSYKAFLQSLDIRFFKTQKKDTYIYSCEADVKLPILKKSYVTATEYKNESLEWVSHAPLYEQHEEPRWMNKNEDIEAAWDPIGFFMSFEKSPPLKEPVTLLVGAKKVNLEIQNIKGGYEVSRPEKKQSLRLIVSDKRIEKIEIPLPMIGSVSMKRVK